MALLACGPADPLPSFEIRVSFNTDALHGCEADDCTIYGMACGGVLGLRIVDAETVEDDDGNEMPAHVYVERCVRMAKSTDVCALRDVHLDQLPLVPAKMLMVEVALYSPDALGAKELPPGEVSVCPITNIFDRYDRFGTPQLVSPQPAFGGATYFRAGTTAFIDVPLACPNPDDVNTVECLPDTVIVTARVDDLETTVFVPQVSAGPLDVDIAKPTEREIGGGDTEWVILSQNAHELALNPGVLIPEWTGAASETFGNTACVLTLDKSETAPTTAAHCHAVPPAVATLPDELGYLVSEDNLRTFLDAMGLLGLPSRGLVVGRVVDNVGNPLSNVVVAPKVFGVEANVEYLNAGRLGTGTIATSANGYFFSDDAEFNTLWKAAHPDGRREEGTFQAGLLAGKVSVIVIKMRAP